VKLSSTAPLLVRADAGPAIGTGHLIRCLALGQAWRDRGGAVVFATATRSERLLSLLDQERFEIQSVPAPHPDPGDAEHTIRAIGDHHPAWIAVDGYAFDEAYYAKLKTKSNLSMAVDDTAHLSRYDMDLVLNPNAHATLLTYATPPGTRLLLGPQFVLLRKEFRATRRGAKQIPDRAERLFVSLGGADPWNATSKVVNALGHLTSGDLVASIVVGPLNPFQAALEQLVAGDPRLTLVQTPAEVASLMKSSDLAIVSGGTTVWELAFMGTPALVLESGPQERLLVRGLEKIHLFRGIGSATETSERSIEASIEAAVQDRAWRSTMSERGRRLVDGKGSERAVSEMIATKVSPDA